mgnify:FL=1
MKNVLTFETNIKKSYPRSIEFRWVRKKAPSLELRWTTKKLSNKFKKSKNILKELQRKDGKESF